MARVVMMSSANRVVDDVLPALGLLSHEVTGIRDVAGLTTTEDGAVVVVDACVDLVGGRGACRAAATARPDLAVIAVVTEGGLAAVNADWEVGDVILTAAGPAEVDARLRLAAGRRTTVIPDTSEQDPPADLVIDASGYSARLKGAPLDLTYKEFELLKCLVSAPGRVFSRAQILEEVWGYDYYGGTRTVDVHIRRLRAKLGPEHEGLIGTVRNVGYRYGDR